MPEERGVFEGRARLPKGGEVLGVIEASLGANKLRVRCADGKMRICRIPGKLRKRLWMREGDVVIVEPWQIQGEKFGDAVWRYTAAQVDFLRRRGLLKIEL